MQTPALLPSVWHPVNKFLLRFFFCYFLIYCFPFPLDSMEFLKPIARPVYHLQDLFIPWLGKNLFHIHAETAFDMFDKVDDSGYGLVFMFSNFILSLFIAILWSFIDRRRSNYDKLYQWLKLYLRFFLAAYLFGYGFIKVFPSQFQEITASRLTQLVGDQSPMLLAWNFMGHSTFFTKLMGYMEVVAGFLLLFRQTITLGAILSIGVFSFVTLMDFCFNVPVTLLSSHLLLISVYLVLEDRQKLLNTFFLNKPTASSVYLPLIKNAALRKIFTIALWLIAAGFLYTSIANGITSMKEFGVKMAKPPLYGVYQTASFVKNNDTILPLETDSLRWKQLVIDGGSWKQSGIIQFNSGKKARYEIKADTLKKTLQVKPEKDSTKTYNLNYRLTDPTHILFKGLWGKDSIEVLMNKYDLNNFLLYREKFRWIDY